MAAGGGRHGTGTILISSFVVTPLEAQTAKCLAAMRETWIQSLGWEGPLEKEMATHSSTPCLENSMDGGACWATAHGVAKSRTRLSDFIHSWVGTAQNRHHVSFSLLVTQKLNVSLVKFLCSGFCNLQGRVICASFLMS